MRHSGAAKLRAEGMATGTSSKQLGPSSFRISRGRNKGATLRPPHQRLQVRWLTKVSGSASLKLGRQSPLSGPWSPVVPAKPFLVQIRLSVNRRRLTGGLEGNVDCVIKGGLDLVHTKIADRSLVVHVAKGRIGCADHR